MPKKIFISYRRADTQMAAGRLRDALIRRFGDGSVFRDKEGIRPGYDWADEIQRVLNEDVVFLALIGPQWTGAQDAHGRRRLDDEQDSNRIEIETALEKKLPVIPVLIEGATVPDSADLPSSLVPLTRRNAIRLRDDDWETDFTRLFEAVVSLGVTPAWQTTGDSATEPAAQRQSRLPIPKANNSKRLAGAGLVAAILVGVGVWALFNRGSSETASSPISGVESATGAPTGDRDGGREANRVAGPVEATAPSKESPRPPITPSVRDISILEEDFANNIRRWPEEDAPNGYAKVENGVYRIEGKKQEGDYFTWLALDSELGATFELQATIRHARGPDNFGYGVFWAESRALDPQYVFEINDIGEVTYGRFIKGSFSPVVSWTPARAIVKRSANRLRVTRRQDKLELWINSELVRVVAFPPTGIRVIGFRVNNLVAIEVDDVRVTEAP